ncbi:MAG: NVEALA domain-containing protein [Dysgonamonadaceae bacterium]|nr:NVEALA domain-containing protein [Dysgonamonadaceae bacterium]
MAASTACESGHLPEKAIMTIFAVAVIAVAAGLNVMQGRSEIALSDVALANVEALAEEGGSPCGGPKSSYTGMCEAQNTINCKDTYGCQ